MEIRKALSVWRMAARILPQRVQTRDRVKVVFMSNTKHTPGPWRIGDAGMMVFGPPNGNPAPEVICNLRRKVNGSLVAAAPDLLAACEALLTCAERDRIDNVFVTEARAAVAKARDL
jgi:hypothetical protein